MRESILYVVPGKVGGVVTNIDNLQAQLDRKRFVQHTVLTYNDVDRDVRFEGRMRCDDQNRFTHALPLENLHAVLARFRRILPAGEGVLVASDWIELAAVCRYGTERAVLQVVHGDFDYYYDLAERHRDVIDAFVACSRFVRDKLVERIPSREKDIYFIPYGVPLRALVRRPVSGPLRLIYAGRLDQGQKRILDLPEIDAALRRLGVRVSWTVVGHGPDAPALRDLWNGEHVSWAGMLSNEETVALMSQQDVFVLPSQAEGLPLALLEAMSVGLVPVVSDLASGIPEVVREGVTGRRLPVGDVEGFARAIAALDRDRSELQTLSTAARELVHDHFGIARQAAGYEELYLRWRELRRPKRGTRRVPYGSRLDRPWIPNRFVRFVREHRRPELRAMLAPRERGGD